jgi:hypothetical protein
VKLADRLTLPQTTAPDPAAAAAQAAAPVAAPGAACRGFSGTQGSGPATGKSNETKGLKLNQG